MSIETEIRTRLAADATVSGLVSTRIYAVKLPQKPTYPAVTYSRVSGERLHNLGGTSGRARMRLSISSWATTYVGAQALAAAIRASLDGFNGTLTTIDAVILIENEIDLSEDEPNPDLYRILQDYMVNHTET